MLPSVVLWQKATRGCGSATSNSMNGEGIFQYWSTLRDEELPRTPFIPRIGRQNRQRESVRRPRFLGHRSWADSALAWLNMGMPESGSFHDEKKSA
jgi:hypothetical protein